MDKKLKKLWTSTKSPVQFALDAPTLYRYAKEKIPGLTLNDTKRFLLTQPTYTRHRHIKYSFPRSRVISYAIDYSCQCDTAHMTRYKSPANKQIAFLFVLVDVLSSKLYVQPMTENKSKNVAKALHVIFEQMIAEGRPTPTYLYSDFGREMLGETTTLLRHFEVRRVFVYPPKKCSVAETYVRIVKERIARYMTENDTRTYLPILQQLVDALNDRFLPEIQMSPNQVSLQNELQVFQRRYGEILRSAPAEAPKLRVGQHVRLALNVFSGYSQYSKRFVPQFSEEVYRISGIVYHPPRFVYHLTDRIGNPIEGSFYKQQLSLVHSV